MSTLNDLTSRMWSSGKKATSPAPTTQIDPPRGMTEGRLAGANEATKTMVQPNEATAAPQRVNSHMPKQMTYQDMIDKFSEEYKPLSPEDMEKQRKKNKREAIFSAIGDGIAALSNLYFTSQGAQNAYNPAQSLSGKAKARWDKAKAEQDANKDKYLNYLLQKQNFDIQQKRYDDAQEQRKAEVLRDEYWKQVGNNHKIKEAEDKEKWNQKNYDLKVQQGIDELKMFEEKLKFNASEGAKNRSAKANDSKSTRDPHTTEWYETKIGELYEGLPDEYKKDVGQPIKDAANRVIGRERPSITDMKAAIGGAMAKDKDIKKRVEDTFTRGADLSDYNTDEEAEAMPGVKSGNDDSMPGVK